MFRRNPAGLPGLPPIFLLTFGLLACTTTIEGVSSDEATGGVGSPLGGESSGGSPGSLTTGGAVGSSNGGAPGSGAGGSGTAAVGATATGGTAIGGSGFGDAGAVSVGGTAFGGFGAGGGGGVGVVGGFGGTRLSEAGTGAGGSPQAGSAGNAARAGAGGSGGGSSFAAVSGIITRVCATAMCHGGRRNPNLTATNLYTTLMNTSVRQCGSDRMVTPRDTANSALLEVVNGQCGNLVMPEGCDVLPCLDTPELKTISDWIAAGAPR